MNKIVEWGFLPTHLNKSRHHHSFSPSRVSVRCALCCAPLAPKPAGTRPSTPQTAPPPARRLRQNRPGEPSKLPRPASPPLPHRSSRLSFRSSASTCHSACPQRVLSQLPPLSRPRRLGALTCSRSRSASFCCHLLGPVKAGRIGTVAPAHLQVRIALCSRRACSFCFPRQPARMSSPASGRSSHERARSM